MAAWLSEARQIVGEVVGEWQEDRVSGVAAEIAFWAVLSLFPSLIVVAATLGLLEGVIGTGAAADVENSIVENLEDILGTPDSNTISEVEQLFSTSNAGLFTFGVVTALYSASRAFAAIIKGLDVAYDVDLPRTGIGARVLGIALALGSLLVGAITLTLVVVGPLFGRGSELADDFGVGGWFATVWDWVRFPLAVGVLIAWAATIYHVAPRHYSPWRWDLPGAVVAAVGWLAAAWGFQFYLDFAGGSNAVLSFFGGGLALMLFTYLLALVLLVGAELNEVLAERYGVAERPDAPPEVTRWSGQARAWLAAKGRRARGGAE